MLKIYGRATSVNVQKVMWLVGELNLPHERTDLGGKYGGLDTPEFRAKNPNGLIPVIDDGGAIIWESNAIVRYLAAKHAPGTWWPTDPAKRAAADKWMDWMLTTVWTGFAGVFVGQYRTKEANRDWPTIRKNQARWNNDMTVVENALAGRKYLGGDTINMADLPIGGSLYRYFTIDFERPKLPNVEAWYQRLCERPAYKKHVMVPYDELKDTF